MRTDILSMLVFLALAGGASADSCPPDARGKYELVQVSLPNGENRFESRPVCDTLDVEQAFNQGASAEDKPVDDSDK